MKRIYVPLIFLLLAILACSSASPTEEPGARDTQVSAGNQTITAIVESDAPATYTPYPTYTPMGESQCPECPVCEACAQATCPPLEVQTIMVTATPLPDWTLINSFEGEGKNTTDLITLLPGYVRITWTYEGESNFAFYFTNLETSDPELIENTIGNASGQYIEKVRGGSHYIFDIAHASGYWTIKLEFKPE